MATKNKIIFTATDLIKTRGCNWSYEDISAEVGIRKASIHYHFPSKDDLIYAAIKTYIDLVETYVLETFHSNLTIEEKFMVVANAYLSNFDGNKNKLCLCMKLSQDLESLSQKCIQELQKFHLLIRDIFVATIEKGLETGELSSTVDPLVFTNMFFSTCQGMHLLGCYYLCKDDFLKTIRFMLKLLRSV